MSKAGIQSHRNIGKVGEDIAVNYLKQNGYMIIEQNYYYNHGEIDIVAKEHNVLVFIEVKSRHSSRFGEPEESVTPRKQELIRRTAEGYVIEKGLGEIECRFDVVSVLMIDEKIECKLLKNCF